MPLIVVIAFVLLVSGAVFHQTSITSSSSTSPSPTILITPKSTTTPIPTKLSPTKTPQSQSSTGINVNWRYPDSLELSSGTYSSSSDINSITDWYKNLINQSGYNVKSFVKTKANDKVLNKLSASKNSQTVSIEISQNPGETSVKIIVVIDNN